MSIVRPARTVSWFAAFLFVTFVGRQACAVQVNFPAEPVQPHEGCSSGTAEFCDLRIYQVMVESFVDGDPARNYNAGYGTSHHRGDIRGIINSLDYMKSIGMNAVWLTPIFDSYAGAAYEGGGSNLKLDATGYYTRDYFKIDPKFGTLADAQELVNEAHERGMYVLFDGVFGHHKGNLIPSPTGKLPVNSSPGVVNWSSNASRDFYIEVATYWINQLGIDGWRLDQAYQVPPSRWVEIRTAVEQVSAQRAAAGHQWGTLGYMVAELWRPAGQITDEGYGDEGSPVLYSAFDFPVRYGIVGVVGSEENEAMSGRPASVIAESWAFGAHDNVYPDHAVPNLMLGNHDLVRFGDLLQRADIANPADAEYWARHKLAFVFQAAYTGPITRYYGEEIGDELPNYANRVTNNCANLGVCDDHVARTSAKILGVTVTSGQLSANQHGLLDFHADLMAMRENYAALSHGSRQHLYSDDELFIDLKTLGEQQIVFAMNAGDTSQQVRLNQSLFDGQVLFAWDLLSGERINLLAGSLDFAITPLSGRYLLVAGPSFQTGDFDQDGDVDSRDYEILRESFGTARADANGDGTTDAGDYVAWRKFFDGELGSGSESIETQSQAPEASSIALIAIAIVALSNGRKGGRGYRYRLAPNFLRPRPRSDRGATSSSEKVHRHPPPAKPCSRHPAR
jgi:glycosidase